MKKLLLALATTGVLTACGSSASPGGPDDDRPPGKNPDGPSVDDLKPPSDLAARPEPLPTDVGWPVGDPVVERIGPEGGVVSYGKGGPTLEIPAGALESETEISIEWITGTAPHARGRTFRLGPDEVAFAKPVKVSFELPPEALGTGSEEGLGVAYQDGDGFWQAVAAVTVDVQARRVVAEVGHFSDWTVFQELEIRPAQTSVRVNGVAGLWLYRCVTDTRGEEAPLIPVCNAAPAAVHWAANGVDGGDSTTGTLTPMLYGAGYQAPAKKPSGNPVAVTAEVPLRDDKRKALLVSSIRVVDGVCSPEAPCTWSGSTRQEYPGTGEWSVAQVRWVVDLVDLEERIVAYRAEGTLVHHIDPDGCYTPVPMRLENQTSREIELRIHYPDAGDPEVELTDSVAGWSSGLFCAPDTNVGFEAHFSAGELELTGDGTALVGGGETDDGSFIVHSRFVRD